MKNKEFNLKESEFAFNQQVENNKQANLNADRLIKLDELNFKIDSFAKTHGLDIKLFELNDLEFGKEENKNK